MTNVEEKIVVQYDFTKRNIQRFMEEIILVKSNVYIIKDDRKVNAKSIIGLLSVNLTKGDNITVAVCGNNDIANDLLQVKNILGELFVQGDI